MGFENSQSKQLTKFRFSINKSIHNSLDFIRDNSALYIDLWEQVLSLYESHLYDHPGYSLSIENILLVCKECLLYDIKEVADIYEVPISTLYKMLREFVAAVCFVVDDENQFPVSLLNEESLSHYYQFLNLMDRRYLIDSLIQEPVIDEVLEKLPIFKELVVQLRNRGTIRPFLKTLNLRYENAVNLDNTFYNFVTKGDLTGGNLTLLRRALYAQWLETKIRSENREEVRIVQALESVGRWAILSEKDSNKTKRNLKRFFEYLIISEIKEYLNRIDLTDEDCLDVFPQLDEVKESSHILQFSAAGLTINSIERADRLFDYEDGIIKVPLDWEKFFEIFSTGPIPRLLTRYIRSIVQDRNREALIEQIASTLRMKPSSARRVYDKSLYLIDYLLSTKAPFSYWPTLESLFSNSIITKIYEDYKVAIQSLYQEF